jgi:hypothetical protein
MLQVIYSQVVRLGNPCISWETHTQKHFGCNGAPPPVLRTFVSEGPISITNEIFRESYTSTNNTWYWEGYETWDMEGKGSTG